MLRLTRSLFAKLSQAATTPRKPRHRLTVERLEDRLAPAVFSVTSASDSGAGSLRTAIFNANILAGPDIVVFSGPTFSDGIPDTIRLVTGQLQITDSVSIVGSTTTPLTISGNNSSAVFRIDAASITVTLDRLIVTEGRGNDTYGTSAIHIEGTGTTCTISNCTITSNAGGITLLYSTLNLLASTVSNNTAFQGGGIQVQLSGRLNIVNSTLASNRSNYGAGIWSYFATIDITNSLIAGNVANVTGGGIECNGRVTMNVRNSTLADNSANYTGGGISSSESDLTLINCTVARNQADRDGNSSGNGGGIWTDPLATGSTRLFNTLVAGNRAGSSPLYSITRNDLAGKDVDTSSANNLIGDEGSAGGLFEGIRGNRVGDGVSNPFSPLYLSLEEILIPTLTLWGGPTQSFPVLAAGRAANAGSNAYVPPDLTTDQRGGAFARIVGGTVDIGAFEGGFGTTGINFSAGRLLINDMVNRTDTLSLRKSGTSIVAFDPTAVFATNVGTVSPDGHTATLPLAWVTKFVVTLQQGNDRVTFDFASGGFFSFFEGAEVDGGAGVDTLAARGNGNFTLASTQLTAGGSRIALAQVERAILQGGVGNNVLDASRFAGFVVLDGGAGKDVLKGSAGRSILIGGLGADTLVGGVGEDLLIGGRVVFDVSSAAFAAIANAWAAPVPHVNRLALIRSGAGLVGGARLNAATAPNDAVADVLWGAGGRDWLWAHVPGDILPDRSASEAIR